MTNNTLTYPLPCLFDLSKYSFKATRRNLHKVLGRVAISKYKSTRIFKTHLLARLYGGMSEFNIKACQGDDGFAEDKKDPKTKGFDHEIPSKPNIVGLHEESQTNEALIHKECERRKRKMCPTNPSDEEIRVCPRMLQLKDANLAEGSELGDCSIDALNFVECDAIDPLDDVKSSKHELELRPKEVESKVLRPKCCWVYPFDNEEDLCNTIIRQEEQDIEDPSNVESLKKSNHYLLTFPTVVKVESSGCFPKLQDLKEKWETEMWKKSRRLEMAMPLNEKKLLEPSKGKTKEITHDIQDIKAQSSFEDSHIQLSSCFSSQPKHNESKLSDESSAQNSTNMEVQGEKIWDFCRGMSPNDIEVENKASQVQEKESKISQHILEQSNEGDMEQYDYCLPMCLPKKDPPDEHVGMIKDLCSTSLSSSIDDCNHNATISATMLQTNSTKLSSESIKNSCSPMGFQPTNIFKILKSKELMKVNDKKEDEMYIINKKSNESDTKEKKVGHGIIKACMESKSLEIEDQNAKKLSIESKGKHNFVLERLHGHSKQLKTIDTNALQTQQKANEPLESLGIINQDTNIIESTTIIDEALNNTKSKRNIIKPRCWIGLSKATQEDTQAAHHEEEKKNPTSSTQSTTSHTSLQNIMPLNGLDPQNVDVGTQNVKNLKEQELDKKKQLKSKPILGTCACYGHVDKISTKAQVANTSEANNKETRLKMMKPSMNCNILNAKKKVTEKPINESTNSIVEALENRESERRITKHHYWVGLCRANQKDLQGAHQGTNEEKHATTQTTQTTNSITNLTAVIPQNALNHQGLEGMIEDVQNCKGNKLDVQKHIEVTTKLDACKQYSPSLDISIIDGKQTKTSDIKTLEPPQKPCIELEKSSIGEQNIKLSFDNSTKNKINHMKEKKEEDISFGACLRSLSPQSIRRAFKAYRRNNSTKESLETIVLSPITHDVAKLNVDTQSAKPDLNQLKTYGRKYSCLNLSPQSVRNSIQRQQSRHVDINNNNPLGKQRNLGETYFMGIDPSSTNPEYEVLRLVEEPNTTTIEVGRKQSGISCWNPSLWSMRSSLKESQESKVDTNHCKDKLADKDHSKILYQSTKSESVSFLFPEVLGSTTSNEKVITNPINEIMQSHTKKSKWSFCNSLLHTNLHSQTLDDDSSNLTEEETSTSDGDFMNIVDNTPNGASCCSVSPWSVCNSVKHVQRMEEGVSQSIVTHEYSDPNQSVDHMQNDKTYESPIKLSYHDKNNLESNLQMSTSSAQNSIISLGGCKKETTQSIMGRNSTSERTMDDSNTLNELAQIQIGQNEELNAETKGCWTQTLYNYRKLQSTLQVPSGCLQVSSLKSQGSEGGTYGTETNIDSCSKTPNFLESFNQPTHDQLQKDPINELHGVKDGCWAQNSCNSDMLHSIVQSKFDPSRESKEEMKQTKSKIGTIDARNISSLEPYDEQAYDDHHLPKDKKCGSLSLTNGCWTQPPCDSQKWQSTMQMQKNIKDQDLSKILQSVESPQQPQKVVLS